MIHYRIRWSDSQIDWQVFDTQERAEKAAKQLTGLNEHYEIAQFDSDCPRCSEVRKLGFSSESF